MNFKFRDLNRSATRRFAAAVKKADAGLRRADKRFTDGAKVINDRVHSYADRFEKSKLGKTPLGSTTAKVMRAGGNGQEQAARFQNGLRFGILSTVTGGLSMQASVLEGLADKDVRRRQGAANKQLVSDPRAAASGAWNAGKDSFKEDPAHATGALVSALLPVPGMAGVGVLRSGVKMADESAAALVRTSAAKTKPSQVDGLTLLQRQERHAAEIRAFEPAFQKLATEEISAISQYTDLLYTQINRARRGLPPVSVGNTSYSPELIAAYDKLLLSGISKLPNHRGTVWRGAKLNPDDFRVGQIFEEKGYSSTSLSKNAALKFAEPGEVLFKIDGKSGKDISATFAKDGIDNEKEILFAPKTRFEVVAKEQDPKAKVTVITVREVRHQPLVSAR